VLYTSYTHAVFGLSRNERAKLIRAIKLKVCQAR
jgi:hypothetical protein